VILALGSSVIGLGSAIVGCLGSRSGDDRGGIVGAIEAVDAAAGAPLRFRCPGETDRWCDVGSQYCMHTLDSCFSQGCALPRCASANYAECLNIADTDNGFSDCRSDATCACMTRHLPASGPSQNYTSVIWTCSDQEDGGVEILSETTHQCPPTGGSSCYGSPPPRILTV
jgi:hypothetical protein